MCVGDKLSGANVQGRSACRGRESGPRVGAPPADGTDRQAFCVLASAGRCEAGATPGESLSAETGATKIERAGRVGSAIDCTPPCQVCSELPPAHGRRDSTIGDPSNVDGGDAW